MLALYFNMLKGGIHGFQWTFIAFTDVYPASRLVSPTPKFGVGETNCSQGNRCQAISTIFRLNEKLKAILSEEEDGMPI